jgi:hypothetical protein
MSNQLNLDQSTPWTPYLSNLNKFATASISASSVLGGNVTNYGPDYTTGSITSYSNPMGLDLGLPDSVMYFGQSNKHGWLGAVPDADGPSLYFDLDNGTGRTEVINYIIIAFPAGNSWTNSGGVEISGSQDLNTYTPLTSSVYYPSGSGIGAGYNATMPFSNTTAFRYYKIKLNNIESGATYTGISKIWGWDVNVFTGGGSTHGSASANLLNPNESNVTGSFKGENNTSLEKFTSFPRENYGWYFSSDIGSLDLNWGDGKKLFRGIFMQSYSSVNYFPGRIQYYKSDTGGVNDWELISTMDFNATQAPFYGSSHYVMDIGTPVKTQYFRTVFYEEGSSAPTSNLLAYAGWMYEMVSASAPPTPTNLTTVAQNNNVVLTWAQNSGSDNRLIDLIYNVERSSNAGSSYTKIATLSGSVIQLANTSSVGIPVSTHYIDTSVADGDYLYRIQAENRHHLTTGSYVTSDSITLPPPGSPKVYITNQGNVMLNPNDTTLIEI